MGRIWGWRVVSASLSCDKLRLSLSPPQSLFLSPPWAVAQSMPLFLSPSSPTLGTGVTLSNLYHTKSGTLFEPFSNFYFYFNY